MSSPNPTLVARPRDTGFWAVYARIVRALVQVMVVIAAAAILGMMVVTCAEVVVRQLGVSIKGVFDLVGIAGAVTMAAALPYTTACKGHVAIEFFFQRLPRVGRIAVDTLSRTAKLALFIFLTEESVQYGNRLRAVGQVSPTLQVPEFWLPYLLAASFALVCLITIYHLFHPGRELIKP